jgi:hypothetical protein
MAGYSPVLGELLLDDTSDLLDNTAEGELREDFTKEPLNDESFGLHEVEPATHQVELRLGVELTYGCAV